MDFSQGLRSTFVVEHISELRGHGGNDRGVEQGVKSGENHAADHDADDDLDAGVDIALCGVAGKNGFGADYEFVAFVLNFLEKFFHGCFLSFCFEFLDFFTLNFSLRKNDFSVVCRQSLSSAESEHSLNSFGKTGQDNGIEQVVKSSE